jgi:hypothetical protein
MAKYLTSYLSISNKEADSNGNGGDTKETKKSSVFRNKTEFLTVCDVQGPFAFSWTHLITLSRYLVEMQ